MVRASVSSVEALRRVLAGAEREEEEEEEEEELQLQQVKYAEYSAYFTCFTSAQVTCLLVHKYQ